MIYMIYAPKSNNLVFDDISYMRKWDISENKHVISFNSPGANGVLNAIFPFWAKMKTVFTASCDDFSKNFRTWNQDHGF